MSEDDTEKFLTKPSGEDSWTIYEVFEELHNLKHAHEVLTLIWAFILISHALAFGAVDKVPAQTPFTQYYWFTLSIPILGIIVLWLAMVAFSLNTKRFVRRAYLAVGIIWLIVLAGLFIFLIIEYLALCDNLLPWCTNGAPSPIDFQYKWIFWNTLAQWIGALIHVIIFSRIHKKVKALLHPMTGLMMADVVRELYTSHGPRYITQIGDRIDPSIGNKLVKIEGVSFKTVADVWKMD